MSVAGLIPLRIPLPALPPDACVTRTIFLRFCGEQREDCRLRSAIAAGTNGGTHQANEDIAIMRSIPNITIVGLPLLLCGNGC